jgi:heme/copper-type cytochrome/quinol oxidase subunit 1
MFRLLAMTYATSVTNQTAWMGDAANCLVTQVIQATRMFFNIFKWVAFWIMCALLGIVLGKLLIVPTQQPVPTPQQHIIKWPVNSTPDYLK